MKIEKYYHIEINRFNKNGFGEATWGLYVSEEKCNIFSVEVARDLLEQATKKYAKRFGKEVDFNFIKVDMGNRIGKYWRDKNRLVIYREGIPVYENNNGTICRDSVALADCSIM